MAIIFVLVGAWALRLQTLQARDIVRKHDIEDIEMALGRYEKTHGTYPPENLSSWCGNLSDPTNKEVLNQIEASLRQDKKYAKAEKLFPTDPVYKNTADDYFYWKTSPASFELLAKLEADKNGSRDASPCGNKTAYDYSVVSFLRNPF
jgi:hypothetical protein